MNKTITYIYIYIYIYTHTHTHTYTHTIYIYIYIYTHMNMIITIVVNYLFLWLKHIFFLRQSVAKVYLRQHMMAMRGCVNLRMYVCMYVCMDGWMDACMYVWMDGWLYGCMDVWMYVCAQKHTTGFNLLVYARNNRGIRFHRIRNFKQYYFNSIPPTSHLPHPETLRPFFEPAYRALAFYFSSSEALLARFLFVFPEISRVLPPIKPPN